MMIDILEFLLLFSAVLCGVLWIGKLYGDDNGRHAAWAGISAIAAAILCLYSSTKNAAVSAVILLAGIIVVSKILYHLDWKLLLYLRLFYLSALLFCFDLIFYLLLCRYFF